MKPPSLILWQRKIGESSNINPDGSSSLREFQHGAFAIKTIRARPMKTPALQAIGLVKDLLAPGYGLPA